MDDNFFIFVGPLVGGLILYAIISAAVRTPGAMLRNKFQRLATLRGKSFQTIVAITGPPTSRSGAQNGKNLYQWMATGYHIALIFDGDICEGVTHEFANCGNLPSPRTTVEQRAAENPQPAPPPPNFEKPVEDGSIPCPLCGQHLKIAALKQGENWCQH